MLYAINYALNRSVPILIVAADNPNIACDVARIELQRRRLHAAILQDSCRLASQADLDAAENAIPEQLAKIWIVTWCCDANRLPRRFVSPVIRTSPMRRCEIFDIYLSRDIPIAAGSNWTEIANQLTDEIGAISKQADYARDALLARIETQS